MESASTNPRENRPPDPGSKSFTNYLEAWKQVTGDCPSRRDMYDYYLKALPKERDQLMRDHLTVCASCRIEALEMAAFQKSSNKTKSSASIISTVTTIVLVVGLGLILFNQPQTHHSGRLEYLKPVSTTYRDTTPQSVTISNPNDPLALVLNTSELSSAKQIDVEVFTQDSDNKPAWRGEHIRRNEDGAFILFLPAQFRRGVLRIQLLGDGQPFEEYYIQLIQN